MSFKCDECGAEVEGGVPSECPRCGASAEHLEREFVEGDVVKGFEIKALIGQGGGGRVYLARQLSMDRDVAIKILPGRLAADKVEVENFLNEIRMLAKLEHPNIVTAYEAGEEDGVYFLAMAYIAGDAIDDRVEALGPMDEKQALGVIRDVAGALSRVWDEHRMLHRDIKPANILLDTNGVPKLTDFGLCQSLWDISSVNNEGFVAGTPSYMSPEQAQGKNDFMELDCSSDIYSLGMTLYFMLTGVTPYWNEDYHVTIQSQINDTLTPVQEVNPKVTASCATILAKAIEKDRAKRYQAWDAFIRDIEAVISGKLLMPAKGKVVVKKNASKSKRPRKGISGRDGDVSGAKKRVMIKGRTTQPIDVPDLADEPQAKKRVVIKGKTPPAVDEPEAKKRFVIKGKTAPEVEEPEVKRRIVTKPRPAPAPEPVAEPEPVVEVPVPEPVAVIDAPEETPAPVVKEPEVKKKRVVAKPKRAVKREIVDPEEAEERKRKLQEQLERAGKSRRKSIVVITIVVLLLLGGLGAAIYFSYTEKENERKRIEAIRLAEEKRVSDMANAISSAMKYSKLNKTDYAGATLKLQEAKKVVAELPERVAELDAEIKAIAQRKLEAVEAEKAKLEKDAWALFNDGRDEPAQAALREYDGEFSVETEEFREALLASMAAKRDSLNRAAEMNAKNQAATAKGYLDALTEDIAEKILRLKVDDAIARSLGAESDESYATVLQEVRAIRRLCSQLPQIQGKILRSFTTDKGKDVTISLESGSFKGRVDVIGLDYVELSKEVMKTGSVVSREKKKIMYDRLSVKERLKRLGAPTTPYVAIMRGALLFEDRQYDKAEEVLRASDSELGVTAANLVKSQSALADSTRGGDDAIVNEKYAQNALRTVLKITGTSPSETSPDRLRAAIAKKRASVSELAKARKKLQFFKADFGSTACGRKYGKMVDGLLSALGG